MSKTISEQLADWRDARHAVNVLLTWAQHRDLIKEMALPDDAPFMLRWLDLPEEKRETILGFRQQGKLATVNEMREPSADALKIACELAGTTWEEAQEAEPAEIDDTPERRREARRWIGV